MMFFFILVDFYVSFPWFNIDPDPEAEMLRFRIRILASIGKVDILFKEDTL